MTIARPIAISAECWETELIAKNGKKKQKSIRITKIWEGAGAK